MVKNRAEAVRQTILSSLQKAQLRLPTAIARVPAIDTLQCAGRYARYFKRAPDPSHGKVA